MNKTSPFQAILLIIFTAAIAATFFIFFTPGEEIGSYLDGGSRNPGKNNPDSDLHPTLLPNEQSRIGIVAGHWGFDSGQVCDEALNNIREVDVNLRIATMVRDQLNKNGYTVDLMQEFDSKLSDYTGLALIAIHNDTCEYINESASGFKVSGIGNIVYPVETKNFQDCIVDRFARNTGMTYLGTAISSDPEMFYSYSMVNDYTTALIIETGYLNLDYRMLTENTDKIAQGVTDGILCYVNNESAAGADSLKSVNPLLETQKTEPVFILPGVLFIQD